MQRCIKVTSAPCKGSAFRVTLPPCRTPTSTTLPMQLCQTPARHLPRRTQHRAVPSMSWQSAIPTNRKLLQLRLETLGRSARALEGCLCVTPSDRCNTAPHRDLPACLVDLVVPEAREGEVALQTGFGVCPIAPSPRVLASTGLRRWSSASSPRANAGLCRKPAPLQLELDSLQPFAGVLAGGGIDNAPTLQLKPLTR